MKKLAFPLVVLPLLIATLATGQSVPQGFNYQTIIRHNDASGAPLVETPVTLLFRVHQETPDGSVVYAETHQTTTNAYGLVNLVIGEGTPLEGNFAGIAWGETPTFLAVEMETAPGVFEALGTTQLMSVPYALYALRAADSDRGVRWLTGPGIPSARRGNNGDLYLDIDSGDVWYKVVGSWFRQLSIKGPRGLKGDKGDKGDTGVSVLNGDVSGEALQSVVTGIQGRPIHSAAPAEGQVLVFLDGSWRPADVAAGDNQTLRLEGNVLSISRGNSVVLPTAPGTGGPFAICATPDQLFTDAALGVGNCLEGNERLRVVGDEQRNNGIVVEVQSEETDTRGIRITTSSLPGDSGLSTTGLDIASENAEKVAAMKLSATNGSASNDGVILFSRAGNGANGMKIATLSDNGRATALRLLAGGNLDDLDQTEGPDFASQNFGVFVAVKDREGNNGETDDKRDIGLYVTTENKVDDYAAYFDGNVGVAHELAFIDPGNGNQWSMFIERENRATCNGCANNGSASSDDLILEFENNIKGLFRECDGAYCRASDRRLKENISLISSVLPTLLKLRPVQYNLRSDAEKHPKLGFIAQEVQALFPELVEAVSNSEYGSVLTLNYDGFSVLAVRAIQEQQALIEQQRQTLQSQEARLETLEREMVEIRALLSSGASAKASKSE